MKLFALQGLKVHTPAEEAPSSFPPAIPLALLLLIIMRSSFVWQIAGISLRIAPTEEDEERPSYKGQNFLGKQIQPKKKLHFLLLPEGTTSSWNKEGVIFLSNFNLQGTAKLAIDILAK